VRLYRQGDVHERPNWRKLTAEQVHELPRELAHVHGATFEAMALLVRAGGISNAEANAQVQQFEEEAIGWPAFPTNPASVGLLEYRLLRNSDSHRE
jgi:hypothetical protein